MSLITRVVDYGGLFHGDLAARPRLRAQRPPGVPPAGWVAEGHGSWADASLCERHGLTVLQLACQWNLAHALCAACAPTLTQESGPEARPIEEKRAELAALPRAGRWTAGGDELRAIGDNAGSMALKGANPAHEGDSQPDRWGLDEQLQRLAERWDIAPERDLALSA